MTPEQLIQFLRLNVGIQDPSGTTEKDPAYLSMTDDEITLYMEIVITRDFSDVPSLAQLPAEYVYPLTLLTKKELYYALASKEAPLTDIAADSASIKRSQRFEHYMKLIAQAESEFDAYLENGGAGGNTLTSFDVLISDRYATKRNYEKGFTPVLTLFIQEVTENSIAVSWKVKISRFESYQVYISENPIYDPYKVSEKIDPDANNVVTIKDIHQTSCRIEGLTPNTTYYVCVGAVDKSLLKGYSQIVTQTLAPVVVEVGG